MEPAWRRRRPCVGSASAAARGRGREGEGAGEGAAGPRTWRISIADRGPGAGKRRQLRTREGPNCGLKGQVRRHSEDEDEDEQQQRGGLAETEHSAWPPPAGVRSKVMWAASQERWCVNNSRSSLPNLGGRYWGCFPHPPLRWLGRGTRTDLESRMPCSRE